MSLFILPRICSHSIKRLVGRSRYERAVAANHIGRARKTLARLLQEQQQLAVARGTLPREPEPAPAPRPAAAAAAVAYQQRKAPKDQEWKELSKRNQKYAEDLGWDGKTWDAGDQAPFETLWTDMDQKKRDAAAALQFNKSMFHHAHDSEDFWETILQVPSPLGFSLRTDQFVWDSFAMPSDQTHLTSTLIYGQFCIGQFCIGILHCFDC